MEQICDLGFQEQPNYSMKICLTEITENHYKKEEYQKKQTVVPGRCHLDGHIRLKTGGYLLQITGQSGYKLSALPEKASDW